MMFINECNFSKTTYLLNTEVYSKTDKLMILSNDGELFFYVWHHSSQRETVFFLYLFSVFTRRF